MLKIFSTRGSSGQNAFRFLQFLSATFILSVSGPSSLAQSTHSNTIPIQIRHIDLGGTIQEPTILTPVHWEFEAPSATSIPDAPCAHITYSDSLLGDLENGKAIHGGDLKNATIGDNQANACFTSRDTIFTVQGTRSGRETRFNTIVEFKQSNPVIALSPECERLGLSVTGTITGPQLSVGIYCPEVPNEELEGLDDLTFQIHSDAVRNHALRLSSPAKHYSDRKARGTIEAKTTLTLNAYSGKKSAGHLVLHWDGVPDKEVNPWRKPRLLVRTWQPPPPVAAPVAVPPTAAMPVPSATPSLTTFMKAPAKRKLPVRYTVGAGLTSLSYTDPRITDTYSSIGLVVRGGVSMPITPRWDGSVSGFFTAFPITKNLPSDVRFLGLNLRFAYLLNPVDEWKFSISTGLYYSTMMVSTNDFGYRNISGPQLYPSVRRNLKNGSSIIGYMKYSPISSNFHLLDFKNRELAAGITYALPAVKGKQWAFSLDYSNLEIFFDDLLLTTQTIGAAVSLTFF